MILVLIFTPNSTQFNSTQLNSIQFNSIQMSGSGSEHEPDYENDDYENNDRSTKNVFNDEDLVPIGDGNLLFNPYNPDNREIEMHEIIQILQRYGVPTALLQVDNMVLYKRAFVHRSYTRRPQIENAARNITLAECPAGCMPLKQKSNERLEFVGDGILEAVTKFYLYRRFPKENEGFMTEKKIAIVKNESIGKLALEMGLHRWFIISKHSEEKKTRTNLKKLGCLFEAFLGAIFLDYNKVKLNDDDGWFQQLFVTGPGFQIAQIFVETVFDRHIDWIRLVSNDDNFKNILQVKIQKEFKTTPDYVELGRDLELGYTMGLFLCIGQEIYQTQPANDAVPFSGHEIGGTFEGVHQLAAARGGKLLVHFTTCSHRIKKKAEQQACEIALKLMKSGDPL